MTNSRVSFPHRLGALLTLLAFIFTTLAPARGVLSQARGSIIFPRYDELGNQLTQTDALGHTTRYSYDNLGRRTGRTLPGGQTESMTYNRPGTVFDRTDFNGTITRHTYDALDRLLTRTVTSTAAGVTPVNVSFTYTASGRRETMTDATGVTRYFYDQRDRLQRKDTPEGALNYGYEDASGLLTNMHSDTSGGAASSYTYDDLGRLKTATDVNGQTTTYGYDEVGNLSGVTLPNGVASGYSYNELNRLQTLEINRGATSLAHFTYAVAPTGHRHRSVESGSGLQPANPTAFRTRTWSYDALWRLRGETLAGRLPLGGTATMPNGTATYALDAVGNRTALTSTIAGLTSQTLAYNANDRITGDTYDANGNTQGAAVSQPPSAVPPGTLTGADSYDAADRLLSRTGGAGNSESLSYDGDGHRVRESVTRSGVTTDTRLLVDDLNPTGYAQVVEEWTNGVLSKVFHYGHALISQDALLGANWTLTYYGYDGHGSVRFLTDALGAVTDTYEYDAFGQLLATTGSTPNSNLYCGERFDPNVGLYYLRARLMNPLTGTLWTADGYEGSQEDPASLHKYLYVQGNPLTFSDPTGMFTQQLGYAAEAAIWQIYETDHPGDALLPGGSWTKLGGIGNTAYRLKPDIFNTTTKRWAEVKPLSTSGLAKAAAQYAVYSAAFAPFGYKPDVGWTPSTHVANAGDVPIFFFNAGGVIFYTDPVDNAEDATALLALKTVGMARNYILKNSARLAGRGLTGALSRIGVLAVGGKTADVARLDTQFAIAVLLTLL